MERLWLTDEAVGAGAEVRHPSGAARAAHPRDEPAAPVGTVRRKYRSGPLRHGGGGDVRQGARRGRWRRWRLPVSVPGVCGQVQLRPGHVLAQRQPGSRTANQLGRLPLHLRRRRRSQFLCSLCYSLCNK